MVPNTFFFHLVFLALPPPCCVFPLAYLELPKILIRKRVLDLKPMVYSEITFDGNVESIKRLYCKYSAEELASALFVSNLWLPNIASYAKHTLFAMALSSMKPE